jgi:hypothetical protein
MLKSNWEKIESAIKPNAYVEDIKLLLTFYSESFKEHVNNVYVIKILKLISETTNEKFIDYSLKLKKVNSQIVQKLSTDFNEIKQ